ncbi:aldose 1-epimerase family protein [Paenirhodobacter sp.]|uniref:aldose 1-epimerase family protein n=1 Tax=Paenirhodobacter sp. TaxID=1965326 RepID=UPI003B40C9F5
MTDQPTTVTIGSGRLRATVSSLGAEMQALSFDGVPLLWHGDAAFWGGRSPVLFPIVGRAEGDVIAVAGRRAAMAQHGFARRSGFRLIAAEEGACCHELCADEASRAVYPFDFRLRLSHAIEGTVLRVRAEVENLSDGVMPFGLGFHPAFLWPLPGCAGQGHRIVLDNGAEPVVARLSGGLLTDARGPSPFTDGALVLNPAMFAEDAMIFPEGAGEGLTYRAESGPGLRFRFENLPNLALWSKPGAPFVCIEPWHGMAARKGAGPEIAARPFSVLLPPGEGRAFGFSVEIV